jgi:hypothetical protein
VSCRPNPAGGALGGTTTVTAANGVATFGTLTINTAGNGYTLAAGSGSLTGATSNAFNVTPPVATHFSVTGPSSATAGAAFTITVTALDANNNTATGYGGTDISPARTARPGCPRITCSSLPTAAFTPSRMG